MRFFSHYLIKKRFVLFAILNLGVLTSKSQIINEKNDSSNSSLLITKFYKTQASVKYIYQCTLNKDATAVAWCADGNNGQSIYIKSLLQLNDSAKRITAADSLNQTFNESEPLFSPDGKKIAFLSDAKTKDQL